MRSVIGWAAVFLIVIGGGLGSGAAHGGILSFDTAADVPLSASPSSTGWYTDRYPPLVFAGGKIAPDGTHGTLLETIGAVDSLANRSSPYDSAFYNTQGRKLDLPSDTTVLTVQLYVPRIWDAFAQSQNLGRLASFWATGFDAANNVTSFPIIEFNNNIDGASTNGFRIWDSFANTWDNVGGFAGYDHWYDIGFAIAGGQEQFFVNGALVGTIADSSTTYFGNVILQGYNSGDSYDINWNNLNVDPPDPVEALPEPSSLAMFGFGAVSLLVFGRWRKGRKSAG